MKKMTPQHRHKLATGALMLAMASSVFSANATGIKEKIQQDCAGCHALHEEKKDDQLTQRINRKGPPLYYAASKYQKEWMQNWLQDPQRIRPGGDYFANHTVVTDEGDVIDDATLLKHPRLSAADAKSATAYLMTLDSKKELLDKQAYSAKKTSRRMAAMNFSKFKGCQACHRDEEDYGGVSGPELYTAHQRLRPEFIASYIRDPQQWEPRSLMPNRHLPDKEIHKLMDYFKILGE
ncbi:MAG: c-type cytochrome [Pseudomonadales bacterium]|nr:c-type cytochrome [Pseudomonadales bacterium]